MKIEEILTFSEETLKLLESLDDNQLEELLKDYFVFTRPSKIAVIKQTGKNVKLQKAKGGGIDINAMMKQYGFSDKEINQLHKEAADESK